ncbi:MAG: acetamidase/formamidase family protein [Fodinibius sp.]|nr:acetamidase/formamidase family protein [Fodinibius sp.]
MRRFNFATLIVLLVLGVACTNKPPEQSETTPEPDYSLDADQTHSYWSSTVEPLLRVESGSVIEVDTEEASDQQLNPESTVEDIKNLSFDPIHPLTGPVYVNGAEPGDMLKVTLHKVELGSWGWTAIIPGFGFLSEEFDEPYLKTFEFDENDQTAAFSDSINIPLKPFPGVMGVAPATDSMLSTVPPRANGGNMDDPHMTEGTTVYFPVFVEGALFSVGDAHAAQGLGEVCGTAIEAPTRIVYEIELIKGGRDIQEPQYETDDYYAVTGFGTTIDEAAKKATRYMIDYLVEEHGMDRNDAYALASLAGDLKIAEVVDVPHKLVTMHMSKEVLGIN